MRGRAKSLLSDAMGRPTRASGEGKSNGSFADQLEQGKVDLGQILNATALKMDEGESGSSFLSWLGHAFMTVLSQLSEAHQDMAREQVKAQVSVPGGCHVCNYFLAPTACEALPVAVCALMRSHRSHLSPLATRFSLLATRRSSRARAGRCV